MPVITISRQFGAAGVPVGRARADRFGAEFLDRAIVAQVALGDDTLLVAMSGEKHEVVSVETASSHLSLAGSSNLDHLCP